MPETLEQTVEEAPDAFMDTLDSAFNDTPVEVVKEAPKEVVVEKPVVEKKVEETPVIEDEDFRSSILSDKKEGEEKKAEDSKDEKPYPPGVYSEKARKNWDLIKGERDAARAEKEALAAEIKTLKASSGVKSPEVSVLTKERDEARAKIAEYEKELAATHIERTEEFKTTVIAPIKEAVEGMKTFAERFKLSTSDIDEALGEPDEFIRNEKLEAIAENIPARLNQNKFFAWAEKFVAAREKEAQLYENASGSMEFAEKKKQEEEASAKLKSVEEYQTALSDVVERAGVPLKDIKEDAAVWEKIRADAESQNFDEMNATDKALSVFASHAITGLLKRYNALKKEHAELRGVHQARAKATPGAGTAPTAGNHPVKDDRDFMDVLGDALG